MTSDVPAGGGMTEGTTVPDVALLDHEGTPFRLSDHRGRPLVLVLHRHLA